MQRVDRRRGPRPEPEQEEAIHPDQRARRGGRAAGEAGKREDLLRRRGMAVAAVHHHHDLGRGGEDGLADTGL